MEYGRILILQYLPERLIPEDFDQVSFEDFFRLMAMAQVARELRIEDIEVGANKGYVEAHPDPQ